MLKAIHASASLGPNARLGPKETAAPLWNTLIDTSYWTAQQATARSAAEAEITALQAQQKDLPLTDKERTDLHQHKELADVAKSATNAAKRKAQLALDQWKDKHMGPKWAAAKTFYDQDQRLEQKITQLQNTINAMATQVETRITPLIKALTAHGALEPLLETAETAETPKLTEFGMAATEVNEANPLLLAKLYLSGALNKANMAEIVGVLGAFIVDREAEEKTQHPRSLPTPITQTMKDVLMLIDGWGQKGAETDKAAGIESPQGYWSLTTLWVQVGMEWVEGAEAAQLASKYELYEGNLMKGLLKLANIVNEWISIATLRSDVDMLETMKTAQTALIRDIVQPESLYLRLN
jgi:superfamily II RNA helicase